MPSGISGVHILLDFNHMDFRKKRFNVFLFQFGFYTLIFPYTEKDELLSNIVMPLKMLCGAIGPLSTF